MTEWALDTIELILIELNIASPSVWRREPLRNKKQPLEVLVNGDWTPQLRKPSFFRALSWPVLTQSRSLLRSHVETP